MMVMPAVAAVSRLIDEVDDAGSRVGSAWTVDDPATRKRRQLAGHRGTPGDPRRERESIGKHSEFPVSVMRQSDLSVDAVIDEEIRGLCCGHQCQAEHDPEQDEEVSKCHAVPPSGRD